MPKHGLAIRAVRSIAVSVVLVWNERKLSVMQALQILQNTKIKKFRDITALFAYCYNLCGQGGYIAVNAK